MKKDKKTCRRRRGAKARKQWYAIGAQQEKKNKVLPLQKQVHE